MKPNRFFIPVGYIVPLSNPGVTACPSDGSWLPCDGRRIKQEDYPELVATLLGVEQDEGIGLKAHLPHMPGSIIKVRP